MRKAEQAGTSYGECPVRNVISRFGDKWSILVLLTIKDGETVRFNELCRRIPDVSSRVLSSTLKTLEQDGLISRKSYPVVPPKVEYSLTPMGHTLMPIISEFTEWALSNMAAIRRHRSVSAS